MTRYFIQRGYLTQVCKRGFCLSGTHNSTSAAGNLPRTIKISILRPRIEGVVFATTTITHATSRLTIYTSCPFRGLVELNHPIVWRGLWDFYTTNGCSVVFRLWYGRLYLPPVAHPCWTRDGLVLSLIATNKLDFADILVRPTAAAFLPSPTWRIYLRSYFSAFVLYRTFPQKVAATSHLLGKDALPIHYHNALWQVRQWKVPAQFALWSK